MAKTTTTRMRDRLSRTSRRRVLAALGMTAVAPAAGCVGGSDGGDATPAADDGTGETATTGHHTHHDGTTTNSGTTTGNETATIHPSFGYAGTTADRIPDGLQPDHTVGMHVDEEKFIMRDERPVGVEFGAFHFERAGLHVDPGDVVEFDLESPDHTITSLHPGLGRQQRVPDGVPWFSSPVIAEDGFWLYEFAEPGVYDVVCAPHELFGMAMRIVVGEETGPVVRSEGRPPELLSGVLLGTGVPGEDGTPDLGVDPLAPETIVSEGSVRAEDLAIDLALPIPQPTDPSAVGSG